MLCILCNLNSLLFYPINQSTNYTRKHNTRHQLFHHRPAASRLKFRKSFMRTVTPLDSSASSSRLPLWKDSLTDVPASVKMGLEVGESLLAGSGEDLLCWRAFNRLRRGVSRAKTVMRRWGYLERQPDIRASLRQNGTGGGRVFAGCIWRGLALLASF